MGDWGAVTCERNTACFNPLCRHAHCQLALASTAAPSATSTQSMAATAAAAAAGDDDDFARCGRRKQRNPRRKNVEEEAGVAAEPGTPANTSCLDNSELSNGYHEEVTSAEDVVTKGEVCLTKNLVHAETCDASKMLATDPDTYSNHDSDHDSGCHDDSIGPMESSDTCGKEAELSESVSSLTECKQEVSHDNSYHGDEDRSVHCDAVETKSVEEEIEEMMGRSDTVVIYPEPVSDHDPDDDEEGKEGVEGEQEVMEGEYLLKCPHCQKGFTRVYLLKEHITSQHADMVATHMCPECGVSFALKSHLDKHLSLHSPTAQICKICNKTFANVYRLSRHMISHEESSELRKFKCPECGKAFKFKHHLKEHCRIHSGEKPFECTNCGKRFSHSGSYSSHTTSKKCWVMNLKMKRSGGVANVPLVPKAEPLLGDVNLSALQSSMVAASTAPHSLIQFDPSHLHHAQFLNGARPFLHAPHLALGAGMMGGPAGLLSANSSVPLQLQKALMEKKEILQQMQNVAAAQSHFNMTSLLKAQQADMSTSATPPSYIPGKLDENQNSKQDRPASPFAKPDTEAAPVAMTMEVKQEKMEESVPTCKEQVCDVPPPETSEGMPAEVKKVLEIVGATVTQQQQQKAGEEKANLSRLASPNASGRSLCDLAAAAEVMEKMTTEGEGSGQVSSSLDGSQLMCRFCKCGFDSAIDLHQHERYLCDENTELRRSVQDGYSNISQRSPSRKLEEENQSNSGDGDSRKCRARSLISEEQHQILRAHFQTNPRPAKADLEMLARKIHFPKRVVQVWFQNQRARIRRKGTAIPTPLLAGDTDVIASTVASVPYIPVVPQVSPRGQASHMTSSTPSSGPPVMTATTNRMQIEPLDLSTSNRVQPQQAHVNKPFSNCYPNVPSHSSDEGEVLNLSKKSSHLVSESESDVDSRNSPSHPHINDNESCKSSLSLAASPSPALTPPPICMVTMAAHRSVNHNVTNAHYDRLLTSTPHISNPVLLHSVSPIPSITSPPLAATFTNTAAMETIMAYHGDGDKPLKRARKKSWRQVRASMEADAFHMEYDNAIDDEEEDEEGQLFPRKRRSWKQHKVDAGEGMYACDQCDKMFNKQSSLARHKYEHSGQRPFPCDVCSKAFKHKHHLTEHKRLHSGEKPFTCKKCGKKFSHSGSFSQHMNHRYKYCKPLRMGGAHEAMDEDSNQNELIMSE